MAIGIFFRNRKHKENEFNAGVRIRFPPFFRTMSFGIFMVSEKQPGVKQCFCSETLMSPKPFVRGKHHIF